MLHNILPCPLMYILSNTCFSYHCHLPSAKLMFRGNSRTTSPAVAFKSQRNFFINSCSLSSCLTSMPSLHRGGGNTDAKLWTFTNNFNMRDLSRDDDFLRSMCLLFLRSLIFLSRYPFHSAICSSRHLGPVICLSLFIVWIPQGDLHHSIERRSLRL